MWTRLCAASPITLGSLPPTAWYPPYKHIMYPPYKHIMYPPYKHIMYPPYKHIMHSCGHTHRV
jgi:hypothetical protein